MRSSCRIYIIKGEYLCSHCNSKVGINEAHAQKQGFRSIQQAKIKESAEKHHLLSANCSGCGGTIVFEEGDALSQCPFCGRSLVRKDFLLSEEMPELIIPFRITEEEARNCLLDWCKANSQKKEAKNLEKKINLLKGFYLPYEFVKGPVKSKVSRMDAYSSYNCGGYVDNVFINCSKQLDNMLLDGMEPFELDELQAFDFSYVAGHRVKVGDIDKNVLVERVEQEVSNDYASVVRKTLETKAIEVNTDTSSVFRMPVLLPVYYICSGNEMAAVNGQTGKVSVRSIKRQTHFYSVVTQSYYSYNINIFNIIWCSHLF